MRYLRVKKVEVKDLSGPNDYYGGTEKPRLDREKEWYPW